MLVAASRGVAAASTRCIAHTSLLLFSGSTYRPQIFSSRSRQQRSVTAMSSEEQAAKAAAA